MNTARSIPAAVGLLLLIAFPAYGQIGVGAHGGYDVDLEEVFVGANGMFALPLDIGGKAARLNPEFSYYLTSSESDLVDYSVWFAAVNFVYPFGIEFADFYGGIGLELTNVSVSTDLDDLLGKTSASATFSESSTKFGGNIKIGAAISVLFAEIGYHLRSDIGGPYAQGGLRLMIGG